MTKEENDKPLPLPSHSEEWLKLHSSVASLREDLLLRLNDAQRIMEDWESRLKLREEEYREAREHCNELAAARSERWKREKEEMEKNLQARIQSVCAEKDALIAGLEAERQVKDSRISCLIEQLSESRRDIDKIKGLADTVAEKFDIHTAEPSMIVRLVEDRIAKYESELEKLRNDLVNRPGKEDYEQIKNENGRLGSENTVLSNMNTEFKKTIGELQAQAGEFALVKQRNEALEQVCKAKQLDFDKLKVELERLQSIYQNASERDARVRSIEAPCIEFKGETAPVSNGETNELAWLKSIAKGCQAYGLRFLNRILLSFHTSMKTAEWSPITVLAGVSGTGKSELPRLYSHFGGINFLSLSVQSNWDSQEAMLGYFNTIENFFDAQPVLRLLAQSQKEWSEAGFGLKDYMTMVLMDEMNLAHVELYFAEFLSKLEQRRGCSDAQVPLLDVKLGANIEPYKLPLGRNVLWTGTMNQDETTKSLSDKVLDRSIVINFPRPVKLESRTKLCELPKNNGLLPRNTWEAWLKQPREIPETILNAYKERVEKINANLSNAGRAIGHRVWQSIQNYMMNYPLVVAAEVGSPEYNKALGTAFEDQLVQKVMPKLRGIETTGTPLNSCLTPIRGILEENHPSLLDDFDAALKSGYGQFIWSSALYLTNGKDDELLS